MTPQIAKNILAFLDRVQLQGKEAVAWCEAVSALSAILAAPPSAPPPAETPTA